MNLIELIKEEFKDGFYVRSNIDENPDLNWLEVIDLKYNHVVNDESRVDVGVYGFIQEEQGIKVVLKIVDSDENFNIKWEEEFEVADPDFLPRLKTKIGEYVDHAKENKLEIERIVKNLDIFNGDTNEKA